MPMYCHNECAWGAEWREKVRMIQGTWSYITQALEHARNFIYTHIAHTHIARLAFTVLLYD